MGTQRMRSRRHFAKIDGHVFLEMTCPGCGEQRLLDYDPVLRRWNCSVCGWSWSWRPIGP